MANKDIFDFTEEDLTKAESSGDLDFTEADLADLNVPLPSGEDVDEQDFEVPQTLLDHLRLAGHGVALGLTDESAGLGAWLGTKAGQSDVEGELPGLTPELKSRLARQKAEGKGVDEKFDFMGTGEEIAPEELLKAESEAAYKSGKGAETAAIAQARDRAGLTGMAAEAAGSMLTGGAAMKALSGLGKASKLGTLAKGIEAAPKSIIGSVMKGAGAGALGGAATGLTEGESDIFTEGDWSGTLKDVAEMAGMGSLFGGVASGAAKIAPSVARAAADVLKDTRDSFFSISRRMAAQGEDITQDNIKKYLRRNIADYIDDTDELVKKSAKTVKDLESDVSVGLTGRKAKKNLTEQIDSLEKNNDALDMLEVDDVSMEKLSQANADSIVLDATGIGAQRDKLGIPDALKALQDHVTVGKEATDVKLALSILSDIDTKILKNADVISGEQARKVQQKLANIIYTGDTTNKIGTAEIRNIVKNVERNTQNAITEAVDGVLSEAGPRAKALDRLRKAINLQQAMKIRKRVGLNKNTSDLARAQKMFQFMSSKAGSRGLAGLEVSDLLQELDPKLAAKYAYIKKDVMPLWNTLDKLGQYKHVDTFKSTIKGPISEIGHVAKIKTGQMAGKTQAALNKESAIVKRELYNKIGKPLSHAYDKVTDTEIGALIEAATKKGAAGIAQALGNIKNTAGRSRTARMYALARQPAFQEITKGLFADEETKD